MTNRREHGARSREVRGLLYAVRSTTTALPAMPRRARAACLPDGRYIRANADGDGQPFADVDLASRRRVADVNVEAARSDVQARLQLHDRRQPRPRCEYPSHDVPAPLETPLLEPKDPNTSSSSMQAEALTHDIPPMPRHSSPPILACYFSSWHLRFFIRADLGGSFHTYPSLGGPFQSLQEAKNAIASHLVDLRSPIMCTDGLSKAEICIREALYWPDGTRKKSSKSNSDRRNISLLVQALLDKYNEDHCLLGDLAYELDDFVIFRQFYMGMIGCRRMYYHLNFTTKTKGADDFHGDANNLFFAEVARIKGEKIEYVLNCLYMVKHNDNGRCYGCMSYGNADLRHPVYADKYEGRHSRPFTLGCGFDPWLPAYIENEEDRLADEEDRIRRLYKCLDEPPILSKSDGSDGARMSVGLAKRGDVGLAKRDGGQGSGKYIVPARR
ncbi:hypothetical protein VPH35_074504 [Triticum aestivum]